MKINKDDLKRILPDYLKGTLSKEEKEDFEHKLINASNKAEIEGLIQIWTKFESVPEVEPGASLQMKFDTMLEAYKAGQEHGIHKFSLKDSLNQWIEKWWPKQPVYQFGGAFAMLIVGIIFGSILTSTPGNGDVGVLRNEVADLRQMVTVSLLQSQSPAERLRGITYSYDVQKPNTETLQALLNTLNYDTNLNVRLASVEALSEFYGQELISEGVQEALKRQTSPLMQIALIDLLTRQKERNAVELLKELNKNQDYNEAVRQYAGKAIERLR